MNVIYFHHGDILELVIAIIGSIIEMLPKTVARQSDEDLIKHKRERLIEIDDPCFMDWEYECGGHTKVRCRPTQKLGVFSMSEYSHAWLIFVDGPTKEVSPVIVIEDVGYSSGDQTFKSGGYFTFKIGGDECQTLEQWSAKCRDNPILPNTKTRYAAYLALDK